MAKSDPMLEISTALADLADVLERRDAGAAAAMREAMLEVSTPLADLLDGLDRVGSEAAGKIAAALGAIRLDAPQIPAPQVTVEMQAPEVKVVIPPSAGWRFDVDYHPNGAIRGLTARRLEA